MLRVIQREADPTLSGAARRRDGVTGRETVMHLERGPSA